MSATGKFDAASFKRPDSVMLSDLHRALPYHLKPESATKTSVSQSFDCVSFFKAVDVYLSALLSAIPRAFPVITAGATHHAAAHLP